MWATVLIASFGAYLLKFAGYLVPQKFLDHPRVSFVVGLLPVGLLAGLIVQQTFATAGEIVLDGRILGAAIAVFASAKKWPFITVIFTAAGVTALARYFGIVA